MQIIASIVGGILLFLQSVLLSPGSYEQVFIGFKGLDRNNPTQNITATEVAFYDCDNYLLTPKEEEAPKYTGLSVRPGRTQFLTSPTNEAIRGLFQYQNKALASGENVLIACAKTKIFKGTDSAWTTLKTGLSDLPWEASAYDEPSLSRIYMCNGVNKNLKYAQGQSGTFNMQNQDDETTIAGNVYFVLNTKSATADSSALASVEAGQYIKSSTDDDDTKWVEVTTKDATTFTFASYYLGATTTATQAVRSNDLAYKSRYVLNFHDYVILAHLSSTETDPIVKTNRFVYSKKFKSENFPQLNYLDVPGKITGIAKSGSFLIVSVQNSGSNALYFYRDTDDDNNGQGIYFTGRSKTGVSFGSSKSIAYVGDRFFFYSGLGVYLQEGEDNTLLSAPIKNDAEKFANYREVEDYYNGYADRMPQGVFLPTKNLYLLSVPLTEEVNSYYYGLDTTQNTWTRWTGLNTTALLDKSATAVKPTLYMADNTGAVYTLDSSGSTTQEAVLSWFLSGRDITKDKTLNYIELIGRADNPLTTSVATLTVQSIDLFTPTSKTYTFNIPNNTTTDKMIQINASPNMKAKEFKITLTQQATQGAVSWRSYRVKYLVN